MKKNRLVLIGARGLALALSMGTVGFLMARAAGGCSSPSATGTEPAATVPMPSGSVPTYAPSGERTYFPASKSWGGEGKRLLVRDGGVEEGRYFPGTKAPARMVDDGPVPVQEQR